MMSAPAQRTVQVQNVTMRLPSAITALVNRGSLDIGQVAAANRFQHNREIMYAPGLKTPNLAAIGKANGAPEPLTLTYTKACQEMRQARQTLGTHGYGLVVIGMAKPLSEIGRTRQERIAVAYMLRLHLNTLALIWGIKARR